ncbi:cell division protein YceG involved in septum cleavage [Anaerotaenia torta]|uniref:cell division suppressor protein YneA n=1 Tax=Anaerotaenia torta TaxID=433293 RepID=UPI003D1961CF
MARRGNYFTESSAYYQMNKKRIWMAGAAILLIVLAFSILFITKTVTAQRNSDRRKLVTCVEIQKGDTLWSIASRYYTDEYSDMNEYIREIKESNRMVSDVIHPGNYIVVPYYTEAVSQALEPGAAMAAAPRDQRD